MIENADHFVVSMFRGRGIYDRTVVPNLPAARDVKRELDIANRAEGFYQTALIYAITAESRQIHVE
jgi:hypothetical protein